MGGPYFLARSVAGRSPGWTILGSLWRTLVHRSLLVAIVSFLSDSAHSADVVVIHGLPFDSVALARARIYRGVLIERLRDGRPG